MQIFLRDVALVLVDEARADKRGAFSDSAPRVISSAPGHEITRCVLARLASRFEPALLSARLKRITDWLHEVCARSAPEGEPVGELAGEVQERGAR